MKKPVPTAPQTMEANNIEGLKLNIILKHRFLRVVAQTDFALVKQRISGHSDTLSARDHVKP
jgi:hypothetical protein